jgi:hypothetical protein
MMGVRQPSNCGDFGLRATGVLRRLFVWFNFGLLLPACNPSPPPGDEARGTVSLSVGVGEALASRESIVEPAELGSEAASEGQAGATADNLPFSPTGEKLASLAWQTWIYTDTGPKRTRLGYLRVGAVVDARGPLVKNEGCEGGWLRINPRGFVCLGKGATQNLNDPIVVQAQVRPIRGEGFPYRYAMSRERAPERYFRLPTQEQMVEIEGGDVLDWAANWQVRAQAQGLSDRLELREDLPPPFSADKSRSLEKPYGVPSHLRRQVHAGRASKDSGFALLSVFNWQSRGFGLSTEMDLLPLDRLQIVEETTLVGLELSSDQGLPVAFHVRGAITLWKRDTTGTFLPNGEAAVQRGFRLTGTTGTRGMLEAEDGVWVVGSSVRIVEPRDSFPSVATGRRKWIDVSIKNQTLVAYEGRQPVYATLISSGQGGIAERGDSNPEGSRTVRGTFMIYEKSITSRMDGDEDRADSFDLQDVPFVQYFHRGFALHGAYWHDEFGKERSHGCINLAPRDSAWLFEWTDPQVPDGWHAVLNKQRGTVVYVRY